MPLHRIYVVPNAIDPRGSKSRSRAPSAAPSGIGWASSPAHLVGLFVGHNFALKGLKPSSGGARRSAARTIDAASPIHLLVCGGGDTRSILSPGPPAWLGSDTVHFLGFYPDVEDCYWSSDFFVQPTYYDPCSLVVMEALACGLPVITTAQNGAQRAHDRTAAKATS